MFYHHLFSLLFHHLFACIMKINNNKVFLILSEFQKNILATHSSEISVWSPWWDNFCQKQTCVPSIWRHTLRFKNDASFFLYDSRKLFWNHGYLGINFGASFESYIGLSNYFSAMIKYGRNSFHHAFTTKIKWDTIKNILDFWNSRSKKLQIIRPFLSRKS